jgi:S-adenosylmethionine/arginine decarboxylase-like enzyme
MIERNGPWGQHLMIDAICNKSKITDGENIKEFARELVKRIDMKAYGEPTAVDFANDDPGKGGYTLVQLIETSNICAHFVSATGEAYFDVFSCKEFDVDVVARTIDEFFGPIEHGMGQNILRGAWNEADDESNSTH